MYWSSLRITSELYPGDKVRQNALERVDMHVWTHIAQSICMKKVETSLDWNFISKEAELQ